MTEKISISLPHSHDRREQNVLLHMPDADTIAIVADAMKLLGDPSRLRIFWILCHCEECVLNIAAMTGMSSPAVSHHLRLLKSGGLIESRRSGKEMYYRAASTELAAALHHASEQVAKISCPGTCIPEDAASCCGHSLPEDTASADRTSEDMA